MIFRVLNLKPSLGLSPAGEAAAKAEEVVQWAKDQLDKAYKASGEANRALRDRDEAEKKYREEIQKKEPVSPVINLRELS